MRLRELFAPKLAEIDAGFGIDALRLAAVEIEPLKPAQLGQRHRETEAARLADLVSRLGNRIGFENVVRLLPAASHAPERAQTVAAAAHSEPERWAWGGPPRPIVLFPPEPVGILKEPPAPGANDPLPPLGGGMGSGRGTGRGADASGKRRAGLPPAAFTWRSWRLTTLRAHGPERLAPEWWLDDPAWASGLRDYWRVETVEGPRLWLFHTPANPAAGPAWHAHGCFA
jgi:protein ImuB